MHPETISVAVLWLLDFEVESLFVPANDQRELGIQVWCCNSKAVYQGVQPDFVTMWHELIGETLKFRAGHQNLPRDPALDNRTVIKIENEIREFHQMNPRTGADHGATVITVQGNLQ